MFLGPTLSAEGLLPDESRIEVIISAPASSDEPTLCSLLGLLSWYNKFIPDFATVSAPVCACLQDESGFSWSKEAKQRLTKIKQPLANSPALMLFDLTLCTIVSTDASVYGLGAILSKVGLDDME